MIRTILLLASAVLIANVSRAQPGDPDLKLRLQYFHTILDSLRADPDNPYVKWARVDLLFDPVTTIWDGPTEELNAFLSKSSQFELYVRDTVVKMYRTTHMSAQRFERKYVNPASELGDFLLEHQSVLINDLTELIESGVVFNRHGLANVGCFRESANRAHFYYKRGQFYYFTGQATKALADFQAALDNEPPEPLKERIQTSIAAYHYSRAKSGSVESYPIALEYIHLIEPAMEDSTCCAGAVPRDWYQYEEPKLELMRWFEDSVSYVNYLQNRSAGFLNLYYSILTERSDYTSREIALSRAQKYEVMIYDYLRAIDPDVGPKTLIQHKKIIIDKLLKDPELN